MMLICLQGVGKRANSQFFLLQSYLAFIFVKNENTKGKPQKSSFLVARPLRTFIEALKKIPPKMWPLSSKGGGIRPL